MACISLVRSFGWVVGAFLLGCSAQATHSTYQPPATTTFIVNEKIVNAAFEEVWSRSLPNIGQSFFTINNMEKDSGFMNISYSGDSGTYVDCGTMQYANTKHGGSQAVDLSHSTNAVEIVDQRGTQLLIQNQTTLNTKINVVFTRVSATQTRVAVNVEYHVEIAGLSTVTGVSAGQTLSEILAVSALAMGQPYYHVPGPQPGQVLAQGMGEATFRAGQTVPISNSDSVLCRATGQMEQDILALIE